MNTIQGQEFPSRCPIPDIKNDTRIVALLGTHDAYQGSAAPAEDGWFVSDFYLFHHLFRGICKEQVWLASNSPAYLVEKYGSYHQGDPGPSMIADPDRKAKRKVVLSAAMLPELDDIVVVDPAQIVARVLLELRKACEEAAKSGTKVLLLLFSDGVEESGQLFAGFSSAPAAGGHEEQILLNMDDVRQAITVNGQRDVQVTVISTACYAGFWAITSNLNTTSMLASSKEVETHSWSANRKTDSISGGMFTTAIVETLCRLRIDGYHQTQKQGEKADITAAGLFKLVNDILKNEVQPSVYNHQVAFTAQDDAWGMAYGPRTGIPIADYKKRWDSLEDAPPRTTPHDSSESFSKTGGESTRVITRDHAARLIRSDAILYLNSFPGRDTLGPNAVSRALRRFLQDGKADDEQLARFRGALNYRLYTINAADRWCKALGLDFPRCGELDYEQWQASHPEKRQLTRQLEYQLNDWPMFDDPQADEGLAWAKGTHYLGCALANADWTPEKLKAALQPLFKARQEGVASSGVPIVEGVSRVVDIIDRYSLDRRASIGKELKKLAGSWKRSLRDSSPVKLLGLSPEGSEPSLGNS